MKVILIGSLAALFFSVTFVINRAMELDGGYWVWSASLRFFFMVPMLLLIVGFKRNLQPVFLHLKKNPILWLIWSTVGFGLFYAPLTFATIHGPGWLVAATFQLTIIAGALMVPFISNKHVKKQSLPVKSVVISLVILAGVFLMQAEHATSVSIHSVLLCAIPVLLSAVAYPLGNRKMMEVAGNELNTFQRILGMTIASLPFWLILSLYGLFTEGLPTGNQVTQTFIVAVSSGIIATTLFFYATELVKNDQQKLAGVEATQAGEVIFALLGEMIFLSMILPSTLSLFGILLVILGMILHSLNAAGLLQLKKTIRQQAETLK